VNIVRQPAASTLAIAAAVDTLLKQRPELLPRGVTWTTFYDQAEFVRNSVNGVRDAILIGIALAAVVLFLYLRSFKITAVAVATIPVTVAIVLLALGVSGQTINLMTLGGIAAAIGLVVDDAIVVVENIARHAEERVSENPARSGLAEALPPLTGSSISTIVIFFPFALLSGVAGAFSSLWLSRWRSRSLSPTFSPRWPCRPPPRRSRSRRRSARRSASRGSRVSSSGIPPSPSP
jgi:multidrug efflux pump subunit AcrB